MSPTPSTAFRSIRWKFLGAMTVFVVILWGTLAIFHTHEQRGVMRGWLSRSESLQKDVLIDRGRMLAQDFRHQAESDIAAFSFSGISEMLNRAVQIYPGLAYAILMDEQRTAYVHTSQPGLERTILSEPQDLFAASQSLAATNEFGKAAAAAVMEFIEPIRFGGQLWGVLRLGFSLAPLNQELERMRAEMRAREWALLGRYARISILFFALGALALLLLSTNLTNPLKRLTATALEVARGDFSAAMKIQTGLNDEVGALSNAFAQMARDLKSSYSKLERTVEETRRAEAFLDSIFENLPSMVFVKDAKDLRFIRFNRAGEELLGYTRAELIGKNDYDLFKREQADAFTAKDREVFQAGHILDIPEEPIVTRQKNTRYLHTKKIPMLDRNGKPQYLLGISEDITEWKKAQEALRASEERYRTLFDNIPVMYFTLDTRGRVLSVNRYGLEHLGYDAEELVGQSVLNVFHPDDKADVVVNLKRCLESPAQVASWQFRKICKNGAVIWVQEAVRAIKNAAGETVVLVACEDITERRKLEQEIVQASATEQERFAHDLHDGIGQILTGLAFKSKLMERSLAEGATPVDSAREIVKLANQASEQARALARGLDPVALREGLAQALQDLAYSTKEILGIECAFASGRDTISIDKFAATHLYRIAQEAVNNAVRHGQSRAISIALTSNRGQLSLTVADDGKGMPAGMENAPGMGLRSMRYRARMIGAAFSIVTNDRGGTTVNCTLHQQVPGADAASDS